MVLGGNMQVQKEQIKFIKDKEELKNFGDIMMESSHLLSFVKRTSGDLIEEGRKDADLRYSASCFCCFF